MAYDLPTRYRGRRTTCRRAQRRIAAAAAALLEPGTWSASTAAPTDLRRRRARRPARARPRALTSGTGPAGLTVVTNALNIATEMVLRPHMRTVTLGGIARPESYELVGPLAALVLEELWLDLLFLGVDGFDVDGRRDVPPRR